MQHRIDAETVISVTPSHNPLTKQDGFCATILTNGWPTSGTYDGATEQEALGKCLTTIREQRALESAAEELTDAGIYSDLTTGPVGGIHAQQMEAATGTETHPGSCHYCGLDPRTCDCR